VTEDSQLKFRSFAHAALRIVAGLAYFTHGSSKLFGWFGGFGPNHGTADLATRFGAAGIIETVCGLGLILGLFTRPLAFIASGEMAVAYFWIHWGGSENIFWWQNGGEMVMLFSFIWLLFAAWGPGAVSVDQWLARRNS